MSNDFKKIENELPVLGDKTYINPLKIKDEHLTLKKESTRVNPDPFVLKYNGEYYCYASGIMGVPVLHSKDLVNWIHIGFALKLEDQKDYWAPSVIYHNGIFYMYYSTIRQDENDCHREFMKVATAKSPIGPFMYQKTLFDNFSIDSHVIKNENGEFCLYYSTNDYNGISVQRPGTVILMDRLIDMMTPEGNPRLAVGPTIDQEIFERNRFGDGRDWHTIEGAYYLKRKGKHYLMYSGNAFVREDYFVGYSISEDGKEWVKYPDAKTYRPILRRNAIVEGTGHNSVVRAPNNVDDYIIYHGRETADVIDSSKEQRTMRMDPLLWSGSRMWTPAPSYVPQDVPVEPLFRDLFDHDAGFELSNGWETIGGTWRSKEGQAYQTAISCIAEVLSVIEIENYILEVSLRWEHNHMGGLYGIYAGYSDPANNVQALLDVGKRALIVFFVFNGIKGNEITVRLEKGFDFEAYHLFRVVKTGALFRVYLDEALKASLCCDIESCSIGMVTYYTKAYFDGVELTGHIQLEESCQQEFIKYLQAGENQANNTLTKWSLIEGGLCCIDSGCEIENKVYFKNLLSENFRMSIDFVSNCTHGQGSIGIYPVYKDECNFMRISLNDHTKVISFDYIENGEIRYSTEDVITGDFDFCDLHTVMVNEIAGNILILLDNYLIYQGKNAISDFTAGVSCCGSARFSNIAITRV